MNEKLKLPFHNSNQFPSCHIFIMFFNTIAPIQLKIVTFSLPRPISVTSISRSERKTEIEEEKRAQFESILHLFYEFLENYE